MTKTNNNVTKVTVKTEVKTTGFRYVTTDGLIFYNRKDYLEYMDGNRN